MKPPTALKYIRRQGHKIPKIPLAPKKSQGSRNQERKHRSSDRSRSRSSKPRCSNCLEAGHNKRTCKLPNSKYLSLLKVRFLKQKAKYALQGKNKALQGKNKYKKYAIKIKSKYLRSQELTKFYQAQTKIMKPYLKKSFFRKHRVYDRAYLVKIVNQKAIAYDESGRPLCISKSNTKVREYQIE